MFPKIWGVPLTLIMENQMGVYSDWVFQGSLCVGPHSKDSSRLGPYIWKLPYIYGPLGTQALNG